MKKINVIIAIVLASTIMSNAQSVNWRSINEEQPNIVNVNMGYDYGMTAQAGYGRFVNASSPILLTVDFSIPMGEETLDDFKVRIGGQIELYEINGFSVSGKIMANFRRYENDLVRMASFGSEFSLITGYYKPTWHIAAEFGFDKSITTNLKHSEMMRENYPQITDGWYLPTGGNLFYGIQGSKTLGKTMEISIRGGFTNGEKKDKSAFLPRYAQVGLTKKF